VGEEIVVEKIECCRESYQIDFRFTESKKSERCFVRKDALLALLTVAEKKEIEKKNYSPKEK